MLCQNCKNNTATTFLKTTVNGVTKEWHLCNECAKKMHAFDHFPWFSDSFSDMNNFLSGLMPAFPADAYTSSSTERCPICGATPEDISASGKVGCAGCYRTFRPMLMPYIRRIHGNAQHTGHVPARIAANPTRKIAALEQELAQAVAAQEYERAATIRDQLKALKDGDSQ